MKKIHVKLTLPSLCLVQPRPTRTSTAISSGANPRMQHQLRMRFQLEPVWGKEAYSLRSETSAAREIIAVTEVALAGGFDRFAISRLEMQRTIRALDDIEIWERRHGKLVGRRR